jgi:hypothetical protein
VMTLDGQHVGDTISSIGVHGLVIEKNIFFNWGGSILVKGNASQITHIDLVGNDLQELVGSQPLVEFIDAASAASVHSKGNRLYSRLAPALAWVRIRESAVSRSAEQLPLGDSIAAGVRVSYLDPERSPASYSRSKGAAETYAAFITEVRAQSKANQHHEFMTAAVNHYLRGGFNLVFE